jgi:hypothetical protein
VGYFCDLKNLAKVTNHSKGETLPTLLSTDVNIEEDRIE